MLQTIYRNWKSKEISERNGKTEKKLFNINLIKSILQKKYGKLYTAQTSIISGIKYQNNKKIYIIITIKYKKSFFFSSLGCEKELPRIYKARWISGIIIHKMDISSILF